MNFCYSLHPLGDHAVVIQLGEEINDKTQLKIQMITTHLDKHPVDWIIEYIPAFTTVSIFYDPVKVFLLTNPPLLPYDFVCEKLKKMILELKAGNETDQRVVEIPVCYGEDFGPDLPFVAEHNGLTIDEVIQIHSNGDYLVHMIGFAPGFPYLGGMSKRIAAPRKSSPRLKIPSRTVGIAGEQTGVYPIETPGGWQLIGRTPLRLFRPDDPSPSLLKAGDRVKFKPISLEEYLIEEEKNI